MKADVQGLPFLGTPAKRRPKLYTNPVMYTLKVHRPRLLGMNNWVLPHFDVQQGFHFGVKLWMTAGWRNGSLSSTPQLHVLIDYGRERWQNGSEFWGSSLLKWVRTYIRKWGPRFPIVLQIPGLLSHSSFETFWMNLSFLHDKISPLPSKNAGIFSFYKDRYFTFISRWG